MAFKTIHSNRVENLRAALVEAMFGSSAFPVDPLAKEYVLVDNRVLGDWVNLQIAQAEGIAANINYIQPHQLFWELARALVSPYIPKETPLSKDEMTWKLYGLLEDKNILNEAVMYPVKNYLAPSSSAHASTIALKQYQLASSVADLFDQYLVYRPDWINRWSAGKIVEEKVWADNEKTAEQWQRLLWKNLYEQSTAEPALRDRASIENKLLEQLAKESSRWITEQLPMRRLFVFGMTSMPSHLLDMLMLLGKHIPVSVYVLNPCEHHWFDIQSEKALARLDRKKRIASDKYDIGNPLLASQGQQVKEFVASIYNKMDAYGDIEDIADFSAPAHPGMDACRLLDSIQQEILDLEYQGKIATLLPDSAEPMKRHVSSAEQVPGVIQSVHVHNCHSSMREVEVLHDQLLAMFKSDPALNPRDVVVMMPRVTPYVACIHAVFNSIHGKKNIPYHISDRSQVEESPLLNSLVTLLRLPESRMPLSEVLSLLEVPAIQRRFGLGYDDYVSIKRWLVDVGVRWGMNSEHRQQLGLPEYGDASWEFGFNRLMAGYAISSTLSSESIIHLANHQSAQPYDHIEGANSNTLDALLQFWNKLQQWRTELNTVATPPVWAERLRNLLEDFYDAEDEQEINALKAARSSFHILNQAEERAWFSNHIPLSVIREVIQPALEQHSGSQNHWREGIKFCSLMPMRGVPFKVVYIMGMNMEDYPRRVDKRSFDLMRKHHRAGDRANRIDDRWLFLEALISARQYFHVSYIGRDIFRNEKREPSVVLSELLDYCRHGYELPENFLITEHPLQPFSDKYFQKDRSTLSTRLVSFNQEAWHITNARKLHSTQVIDGESRWRSDKSANPVNIIALNDFIKFFTKPADWFFTKKHKVWLDVEDNTINDDENFGDLSGLDKWSLRDQLIKMVNAQPTKPADPVCARDELVEVLATLHSAEGNWPLGASGENQKATLKEIDTDYLWASYGKKTLAEKISIGSANDKLTLDCTFPVVDGALIIHSPSKYKTSGKLDFYIRLALSIKAGLVTKGVACFSDKGEEIIAENISESINNKFLSLLAALYIRYQETGLPFEVDLSREIANTEDADDREALIEKAWNEKSDYVTGIAYDSKMRSYYGHVDSLRSKAFQSVSETLWAAVDEWHEQAGAK